VSSDWTLIAFIAFRETQGAAKRSIVIELNLFPRMVSFTITINQ